MPVYLVSRSCQAWYRPTLLLYSTAHKDGSKACVQLLKDNIQYCEAIDAKHGKYARSPGHESLATMIAEVNGLDQKIFRPAFNVNDRYLYGCEGWGIRDIYTDKRFSRYRDTLCGINTMFTPLKLGIQCQLLDDTPVEEVRRKLLRCMASTSDVQQRGRPRSRSFSSALDEANWKDLARDGSREVSIPGVHFGHNHSRLPGLVCVPMLERCRVIHENLQVEESVLSFPVIGRHRFNEDPLLYTSFKYLFDEDGRQKFALRLSQGLWVVPHHDRTDELTTYERFFM